ncbi:isochorismatase family protein [Niabella pedocola]|uniref:Isochorismatase family protein n=1 Tax=Niabella pedocola TaxID=1752077 RepID=A0ABS8PMZ3_9BACT|nr:isochorismatase family protein [Niabella pedocola]MCD2422475.1 isochorismatase family protein [Niabella pedocola]
MEEKENSRRAFLKKSSAGGLGAILGANGISPLFNRAETTLSIHPRYHRWYVDPGQDWVETNTGYATLNWAIPLSQVALVLVDVWQRHYIRDTEARIEAVINNNLLPLVSACRNSGLQVIHAPSPPVAQRHPNWVNLVPDTGASQKDSWPSAAFRNLSGAYQAYRRPQEPRDAELKSLPAHSFHPKMTPAGREAVVATGEELHRYCKQKGILFLLYAGFNTNACLITRDYGVLQMCNHYGYQVVIARDCTTGMESKDTHSSLSQTKGAILFFEMFGQYSTTSRDIIKGLPPVS